MEKHSKATGHKPRPKKPEQQEGRWLKAPAKQRPKEGIPGCGLCTLNKEARVCQTWGLGVKRSRTPTHNLTY